MFDTVRTDVRRYIRTEEVKGVRQMLDLFLFNESLIYVLLFRFGQWVRKELKVPVVKQLLKVLTKLAHKSLGLLTGYQIPFETVIGPGLYIGHSGHVIVNKRAVIGRNCNLSAGVVIGEGGRGGTRGCPVLGDFVYVAPGAKIVGKVTVGDNVAIGANAVVVKDVPAGMSVAGVPARIIGEQGSAGFIRA